MSHSQLDANGNVNLNTITAYPTSPGVYRVGSAGDMPVPGEWGNLIIFDTGYVTHIFENFYGFWVQQTEDQYAVTLDGWKKLSSLDDNHPVGSIYLSTQSTSPASLFGGTWEQIKDRFLLAAGDTYSAGETGGAASRTIQWQHLPSSIPIAYTDGTSGDNGAIASSVAHVNAKATGYMWTDISNGNVQYALDGMPPYIAVYIWRRVA